MGEVRGRWSRIARVDGADEQADGKWAELFAAKQLPEGNTGEERLVSVRPELTASPWAMAELVSLCQHVFSVPRRVWCKGSEECRE